MNNLPKVVAQQRRGRASNPRLLDRKSDALPLSHRATPTEISYQLVNAFVSFKKLSLPFSSSFTRLLKVEIIPTARTLITE